MSNPGSTLLTPEQVFGPRPPDTPSSPATPLSGPAPPSPRPVAATISPDEAFGARSGVHTPRETPTDFYGVVQDLSAAGGADFIRHDVGDGSSTPALDHYFDSTPSGHIMKAFGQGAADQFRVLDELASSDGGPDTVKFLKAAGVYEPWEKAHAATTAVFRNGTLRPLAQAADYARGAFRAQTTGAAQAWGAGVAGAFDALRQDITGQPQDMAAVMRDPVWENKVVPIIKSVVNQVPLGTSAVAIFDAANVALSLTGIPQLVGEGAKQLATGWVKAVGAVIPHTPNMPSEAEQIRQLTDKISFAAMLAGPAKGAIPLEVRLEKAQHYGVIKPPPPDGDIASAISRKAKSDADDMKEAGVPEPTKPAAGVPSPNLEPSTARAEPAPAVPRDVHTVAREVAPDVFAKYDPLARRDQWYNDWIGELRAQRDNDPRLQAAQEEIDGILAKVGGVESRLTGRARDRIEDIRGGMEDFRVTDTPDMVRVKQEKLANYQAMQDLAPQVRSAYSAAADRLAREAPETAPEVIEPAPPPPVTGPTQPPAVVETAAEATPALAPRTDLPSETAHIQTVEDIANDISRQAQAAGRSKEEADDFAATAASAYQARSAAFEGKRGTAAELYRENPFSITGAMKPVKGQRTFAQRAVDKVQDLAKTIPGLKSVLPHLLPEERASLTTKLATRLTNLWSELGRKAEEVASVAFSGRIKRGWYKNAAETIHQLFGQDADRFSALLAAMSPQTSVESNLLNALKTWTKWDDAGRPTDANAIRRIIGESIEGTGGEASALPAWLPNSIRALTHPDPGSLEISGPKVNSFALNLRGHVDEVTNDSWMATSLALSPDLLRPRYVENQFDTLTNKFGRKGAPYMAVSAVVRRAAKILSDRTGDNWTPAEVQETVWSWVKTLYEKRDSAGEDRTTRQILAAGGLTHEDILNTPDFASMLIRGVYRKILEEGGYGSELQNVEQTLADRLTADRETGATGDVTSAEGAGIAQPAFERHLRRAADRLESVLTSRREGLEYAQSAPGAEEGELPERGGVSGSAEQLAAQDRARQAYDRGEPLAGLPRKATIPGVGSVDVGPIQRIRDTADAYMKSAGLEHTPVTTYVKVNPDTSREIANAYDEMKDDPENSEVKRAYTAMAHETLAQWEAVKKTGLKVEFFDPKNDPYGASPRLAIQDIKNNNHLWVFSTEEGYGERAITPKDIEHNPMLALVPGETISGKPVRINDIFRIVHDFFGHAQEGNGFRADGEENAWRVHSTMYTPEARRAMTTETRGQNSWLNYGPHGESNRTASTADTVFADQKVGLLPEWISETDVGARTLYQSKIEFVGGARVTINPTPKQAALLVANSKYHFARNVADESGNLYMWDAHDLTHADVMEHFGIPDEEYGSAGTHTSPDTAAQQAQAFISDKKKHNLEQGGQRASITFRGMSSIVRLMKDADASSLVHEFFHHLLEQLQADAAHPLAPQWMKDDWATVKSEYGLKDGEPIPRKAHEQWARGGEHYVMEGRAPNKALAGVFARMKTRMLDIYKTFARLNVKINDNIRGVFDRLLAEPEQRTIITPDRSAARMLADVHEVDAQTTPPEHAALAADHAESEIDQTLQRIAPEIHDALPHKSAGQASPIQGTHPLPAGGADETGNQPSDEGGAAASGAIAARRNGPAQAGDVVRTEPSGAGGPAGGEHGARELATPEPGAGEPAAGGRGLGGGRGELEFIEGTGAPVVSEFSRNIEARAIIAGMPPDFFGDDLPMHGVMSKADQAMRATNLLHDDPVHALAVAMAEAEPPSGLMRPFVVKAVENRARAEGDWETLRQLGTNQKLADERTTIGRQLGAMAEQDPTDPVAAIRVVQKARAAKVKDAAKVTSTEVTAMKDAIRKAPSKGAWASFVDEITCK